MVLSMLRAASRLFYWQFILQASYRELNVCPGITCIEQKMLEWEWNIALCIDRDDMSWNEVKSLHIWIPAQKKSEQVPEFFSLNIIFV